MIELSRDRSRTQRTIEPKPTGRASENPEKRRKNNSITIGVQNILRLQYKRSRLMGRKVRTSPARVTLKIPRELYHNVQRLIEGTGLSGVNA